VPSISCCATNDALDTIYGQKAKDRYFFRLLPPDRHQVPVLARTAEECLGCRSLAVFHRNDDYGNPFAKLLRKLFVEGGGKIAHDVAYDPSAPSYRTDIEAAAKTDADCGVLIGFSADATHVRREWELYGKRKIGWVGSEGILADAFVMMLGNPALAEGLLVTTPVFDPPTPESSSFETFYRATSGRLPSAYNAQMYDSTALMLLAIAQAGSLEGAAVRDALFEVSRADPDDVLAKPGRLSDALVDLAEGRGINYQGASGAVDFGDYGNVAPQYDIYTYTPEGPYVRVGRVEEDESMPCAPAAEP
jgi:branched-chain amino acid transport system substrate-binding protein